MIPQNDREAAGLIIDAVVAAGCTLWKVHDSDEFIETPTRAEVDANLYVADEGYLFVRLPNGEQGWIRFVYGNEPIEVVCDHTVNLSDFIDPVTDPWWDR